MSGKSWTAWKCAEMRGGAQRIIWNRGDESGDDMFPIEECSDADEARWLAERYDAIIGKIHEQMKAQG